MSPAEVSPAIFFVVLAIVVLGLCVWGGVALFRWAQWGCTNYQDSTDDDPEDPEISLGEGPPEVVEGFGVLFNLGDTGQISCIRCGKCHDPADCIRYTGRQEGIAVHCPECGNSFEFPRPMSPRHASRLNLKQIAQLRKYIAKVEHAEQFTMDEAAHFCELAQKMSHHKDLPLHIGATILKLVAELTMVATKEHESNKGSEE